MFQAGTADHPLKVAIVGSGPSGFYACEALLKSNLHTEVDVFERLPTPYGLVRSGVAPDHPKLKEVTQVYARIGASPRFRYFGNVTIGRDIPATALRAFYHAVIFACGAQTDCRLGISGEDLPGSHTATEFVGWYNGHPDYRDRTFNLSNPVAVIIGQGNVAADVARILAKDDDDLRHTDIADHALECLRTSGITDIYVIGRRGPAQAKFTSKELREFGELGACVPIVDPDELILNPASELELADRTHAGSRRVYELFQSFSKAASSSPKRKRVHFTFLKSPVEILGAKCVERVKLEINTLTGAAFRQSAQGTGRLLELEAGLVFRSVGYRGAPIPGIPFDPRRGVIPNRDGRIVDESGNSLAGLYATGWIKRGPSGIIGTNREDSVATVDAVLKDLHILSGDQDRPGSRAVMEFLDRARIRHVSFSDWSRIDRSEVARGAPKGKPRDKYTRAGEMLELLD
jgi:ferredoxin/flavodoxin---NADP+ reductase